MMAKVAVLLYLFTLLWNYASPATKKVTKTEKMIYVDVSSKSFGVCFRRLNAYGQFGCSSPSKGSVGVVHYIDPSNVTSSTDWLVDEGPAKPYVVMMASNDFNKSLFERLRSSGKVNGILLIYTSHSTHPQNGYSIDSTCPNKDSGLYADKAEYKHCKNDAVQWNPSGNNFMFTDIDFPIFSLQSESDVNFLINNCYNKFNKPEGTTARPYPLCAVEMKDFMFAAKDTPTCYRRSNLVQNLNPEVYCDPLGDKNVYGTLKARNSSETSTVNDTIVVATRMDSFLMFERSFASGLDSPVSGMVTLLAVAEAVGRLGESLRADPDLPDILFTFFHGESFDYIGSNRMVYEMKKNTFPKEHKAGSLQLRNIGLENIKYFLEIGQVGYGNINNTIWAHSDPLSRKSDPINTGVKNMMQILKNSSDILTVSEPRGDESLLPPASLQSFLRKRDIPGIVLTEFESEYRNKFYHSTFDTIDTLLGKQLPENITEELFEKETKEISAHLTNVATVVAKSLYTLAGITGDKPVANHTTVSKLLYCLTKNPDCSLLQEALSDKTVKSIEKIVKAGKRDIFNFYVGTSLDSNQVTPLVKGVLAYFIGEKINHTSADTCTKDTRPDAAIYNYAWVGGDNGTGICIRSTASYSEATSPAFLIEDYDWASNEHPAWSESRWQETGLRIFLLPSEQKKTVTLSVGVILLLLSLVGVYAINSKADTLFARTSFR